MQLVSIKFSTAQTARRRKDVICLNLFGPVRSLLWFVKSSELKSQVVQRKVLALIKMNILHADAILGGFKQKIEETVMHVLALILIHSYVGIADRGMCLQLH
jgi:hypothetical protein